MFEAFTIFLRLRILEMEFDYLFVVSGVSKFEKIPKKISLVESVQHLEFFKVKFFLHAIGKKIQISEKSYFLSLSLPHLVSDHFK